MATSNRYLKPRTYPAAAPIIPRSSVPVDRVVPVDGALTPPAPAPTIADVLKALGELNTKIGQLSKNQQTLDTKLNAIIKTLDGVDSNVINGFTWVYNTVFYYAVPTLSMVVASDTGGDPNPIDWGYYWNPHAPHWK